MPIQPDHPVFAVDGEVYGWHDVILHAQASGRWGDLEREAREGLACEQYLEEMEEPDANGEGPDELEALVDEAAAEFRYDRELLTAEEMEAWLGDRDLTPEDWMSHMRRVVLRQHWEARLDDLVADYPASPDAVEEARRVDVICSGAERDLAERFAEDAAAAAAASGTLEIPIAGAQATRQEVLAVLQERASRFREEALRPEVVDREIGAHQMEWIRVDCRAVGFAEESHAREAALCLVEDGLELEEVAASAHVEVAETTFYLDEVDAELLSRFLGAQAGDVVGPLPIDDAHTLYQVVEKVMPSNDDPEIVRRAEEGVLARVLAGEVNRRVRWHAHF